MRRKLALAAALLFGIAMPYIVPARLSAQDHGAPTLPARSVLALTIVPTMDAGGKASGVDVAYTLRDAGPVPARTGVAGERFQLRWATLGPTPGRSSDVVQQLIVRDNRGPLIMAPASAPADGYLLYTADRRPVGPVSVRYHVPVADPSAPNGRGPHRELVEAGTGIATSGDGFLLLPDLASDIDIDLHWQLPQGFRGVSSFGLDDVRTTRQLAEVLNGFYLAGPLRRFPENPPEHGFSAYGLGDNDLDMAGLFAWSAKAFEATRIAFAGDPDTTFRAFYRSYDGGPLDSGRADPNGILLYITPVHNEADATGDKRSLMAHEIIHVFQPLLSDDDDNLWFSEGSADYLSARIPFDAGLISLNAYLKQIDALATGYYGNSRRNIPNSTIGDQMWIATDSWTVPYNRGALYFADLDARVRAESGDKTTLIDLMAELRARTQANKSYGSAQWREIVLRHAGPDGARVYDAMLQGRTIFPVAGAFGPCVKAMPDKVGVFDLLYTTASNSNAIATVLPGSSAERAGLRVGDRLAGNSLKVPSFRDRNRPIEIPIRRDGKPMTIRYVPRTGAVDARRWVPSATQACRITGVKDWAKG